VGNTTASTGLPRRLGRTGYTVSILGVGGWLGILEDPQADRAAKEAAAIATARRAIDCGVNYFDTSPSYGDAERHLGVALHALPAEDRARLYVSSKVGTHPQRPHQYDADSIRWSMEQSLRVLFSDRLDIVYIHDPTADEQMDQIMGSGGAVEALEGLKAQGVVGAIGLGVRNHRYIRRAIESDRFDVFLMPYDYSLVRTSSAPLMELAVGRDRGVVNGSPYNHGLLAIDPDTALRRWRPPEPDLKRAQSLWRWCQEHQVELGALAMQFSLRNERIGSTLAGPRNVAEFEANLRHATASLPPGIWEELDAFLATLGPAPPGGEVE
jgi:aryl-alcohol dehydrogenase-like predicted oxidoreductase